MAHASDWQIIPRNKDLSRTYDLVSAWHRLVLVERYNVPDTWTVTGPPGAIAPFAVPGSGSILLCDGEQVTSGRLTNLHRWQTKTTTGRLVQTMEATYASDLDPLGGRVIFPSPSYNLTTTVSNFPAAYDLRTGAIETIALGYIRSSLGDLSQADRRVGLDRLRIPASLGRGGNTQVSGRLDNLGVLVGTLLEAGNLRARIVHTEDSGGTWLDLIITAVTDLSADVRFGTEGTTAAGIVEEWDYQIGAPTATRAIVAGGGELAARDFLQVDELTAEALWAVSRELLIDQRHVDPASANKQAELLRAGQEALVEGAGPVSVKFTPTLGPDIRYRRDVRVGDIVGYDLPGLDPAKDKIREATTVVTVEAGQATETVSVVVGTPDAPTTRDQRQTARALRGVTVIQRS